MASRIVFQRIGGFLKIQNNSAILLQIARHENSVRRMLVSTPARHYCEYFLSVPSPAEAFDVELISLVRGVNEALLLQQRTIHIQVENLDIANAILNTDVTKDTINTKYHRLMLLDSSKNGMDRSTTHSRF